MLNISGLDNGIVLDHIPAGMSMEIYKYLNLGKLDSRLRLSRMPAAKRWARKISSRLQAALTVSISMSSVF